MTASDQRSDLLYELTRDCDFVDLYVGPDYCDAQLDKRVDSPVTDVFTGRESAARRLYEACVEQLAAAGDPEFSFRSGNESLRATSIRDVEGRHVFILRRFKSIPEIDEIGLEPEDLAYLLDKRREGLIVIAGRQGAGKTSSAASILRERLRRHGGVATAVEDPVEISLNGVHGKGRCMQIRASAVDGGYPAQVKRALRTGAMQILIGEVRNAEAAAQAVQASINGHLVLTTLHAGSIPQAIERLCSLSSGQVFDSHSIVAEGLAAVIHQTAWGEGSRISIIPQCLCFTDHDDALRDRIRRKEISSLDHDIAQLAKKRMWEQ